MILHSEASKAYAKKPSVHRTKLATRIGHVLGLMLGLRYVISWDLMVTNL
jgi:hypothetical protein